MMKILSIHLFLVLFLFGFEHNRTKKIDFPYPFEAEFETMKDISDITIHFDETIKSIREAYQKPLNNDFRYLKEFNKHIKEK